jgi:hypothetical protein
LSAVNYLHKRAVSFQPSAWFVGARRRSASKENVSGDCSADR